MKIKVGNSDKPSSLGGGIGCFFQLIGLAIVILVLKDPKGILMLLYHIFRIK